MAKLSFLAGLAAGYVLGAKAGQKRYEQIRTQADRIWSSDPVQSRVETVKETVRDQAPVVAAKLGDVARSAGSTAREKLTGEHLPEALHRGTDGRHADTAGSGPGPNTVP